MQQGADRVSDSLSLESGTPHSLTDCQIITARGQRETACVEAELIPGGHVWNYEARREMIMRSAFRWAALCLTIALISGCSSAPEVEEQGATLAIAAADEVKAAVYAPAAWQTAEDTLQAARQERAAQDGRFALFRNYGQAKAMFERAAALAAQAKMEAETQREIVRQEATTLLTQAREDLGNLSTRLMGMRVGKDMKAEIELMKLDAAAFQQHLDEAQGDFDRGDFEAARTKAQTVIDRISGIRQTIGTVKAIDIRHSIA